MSPVLFRMTMPSDVSLVPALRQVAERAAQCAGYTTADAQRIATSVARAAEIVLARPMRGSAAAVDAGPVAGGPATDALDIRFERGASHLDVWLRYRADPCERPPVDPSRASEALQPGMDHAEFGLEGDVAFCRLRRALPREKVDHECMPPDAK